MIGSLVLLIAATSRMPCAERLKPQSRWLGNTPQTLNRPPGWGHVRGTMTRTPVNPLDLQMQMATPSDDNVPGWWSNPPSSRWWKADITDTQRWQSERFSDVQLSLQMLPPTIVHSMDAMELLQSWAGSYMDHFEEISHIASKGKQRPVRAKPSPLKIPKFWDDSNAKVIQRLRLICLSIRNNQWEMVGLIPKDFNMPFLESGSSAVDASVLGLGVFSRGQIKDDGSGSIRKRVVFAGGKTSWWTQPWWGVFALEGIASQPGLPEESARVLLAKIARYAEKEGRIVVLSKRAYTRKMNGADLTHYYVRLGFEKVMKDDGSQELVYMGDRSSSADEWLEKQRIMVGMNVWAGR